MKNKIIISSVLGLWFGLICSLSAQPSSGPFPVGGGGGSGIQTNSGTGSNTTLLNFNGINFLSSFTNSYPDTNTIVVTGANVSAANQTYVWSSGSSLFVGQTTPTITLVFATTKYQMQSNNGAGQTKLYSLVQQTLTYTNQSWQSNKNDFGTLPNPVSYMSIISTTATVLPYSVIGWNADFGGGKNYFQPYYLPGGNIANGDRNSALGQNGLITGQNNLDFGVNDAIIASVTSAITCQAGDIAMVAAENCLQASLNGVTAIIASFFCTNNANTACTVLSGNNVTIDTASVQYTVTAGSSIYANATLGDTAGNSITNTGIGTFARGNNITILNGNNVTVNGGNIISVGETSVMHTGYDGGSNYLHGIVMSTNGYHSPYTYTPSGTTGAQTINKASGIIRIAALGSSVVLTDNLISANTIIRCQLLTTDTTAKSVVSSFGASGSTTITLNAAATSEVAIFFECYNN